MHKVLCALGLHKWEHVNLSTIQYRVCRRCEKYRDVRG